MKKNTVVLSLALSLLIMFTAVMFPGCAKTPLLDSVSPSRDKPGAKVWLKGTNFEKTQGKGAVTFDGDKNAQVIAWSDTSIVCIVPVGLEKGQSELFVMNNSGKKSNTRIMNIEAAEIETNEVNPYRQEQTQDREDSEGQEQQTSPDGTEDNKLSQEAARCKSAMIEHAKENSEEGIEFTVAEFWMNDEQTEAEAILNGTRTSGSNTDEPLESPGITARKQGDSWIVTDFGTGIDLPHF